MISSRLKLIGRYGLFWFLYGEFPRHADVGRASWARYLIEREDAPLRSHREGPISAKALVSRLKRERAAIALSRAGKGRAAAWVMSNF
jgi:hypothetical protein